MASTTKERHSNLTLIWKGFVGFLWPVGRSNVNPPRWQHHRASRVSPAYCR